MSVTTPPDDLLGRIAFSMWNAQRKGEIEKLAGFECDPTIFQAASQLLYRAGERERVVIGFSLISACIDKALRYHLSHSSRVDQKDLLDNLGPLSPDAARLKFLRVIGWLPSELSDGIEAVRRIKK